MIYKNIFELVGSVEQQQIIITALDAIKFPWGMLKPPKGVFRIGWSDLNARLIAGKHHAGDHPQFDKDVDVLEGEMGGRKYIMGVFYPSTGNIYIENTLVFHPELARQTVSAEIAHLVDFFLPLTDTHKAEISTLMHGGDSTPHGHSWWERYDYGAEYYTLVGEAFMQAFTLAYSDIDFPQGSFTHGITKAQAPGIRKILGIERTDFAPPAPLPVYKTFPPSLIYHKISHYPKKSGTQTTNISGLVPCKFCKP